MKIKTQEGAALVVATMIVSLCASLATFMLINQRSLIHKASLIINAERMMHYLQITQRWANTVTVRQTNLRKVKDFDQTISGIHLKAKIFALDGRFNVNLVSASLYQKNFSRLLSIVLSDSEYQKIKLLTESLYHWFSGDVDHDYYAHLEPPYQASKQKMLRISELKLVRGFDTVTYQKLVKDNPSYLTALPTMTKTINVNYASAAVFSAVSGIEFSAAKALVVCRDKKFYHAVTDFINDCAKRISIDRALLTTNNRFYQLSSRAAIGEQHISMTALIYVASSSSQPVLLWQEYNSD